jgi:ribonuclease VapC
VIVDSSALIAIANDESGSDAYLDALVRASLRRISAATLLEAAIVVDRHANPLIAATFDRLIARFHFIVEPVTLQQVHIAREAYRRFGKGPGHPARLNFGDCFAYALAQEFDVPLLFVGQDFIHTDVRPALN